MDKHQKIHAQLTPRLKAFNTLVHELIKTLIKCMLTVGRGFLGAMEGEAQFSGNPQQYHRSTIFHCHLIFVGRRENENKKNMKIYNTILENKKTMNN